MQLPEQIIEEASNVLGETDSKLTYRKMTEFFVSKGNVYDVDIPVKKFIRNQSPTKREAIRQNLSVFADDKIQLEIILELCELEEIRGKRRVQDLKFLLINKFGNLYQELTISFDKKNTSSTENKDNLIPLSDDTVVDDKNSTTKETSNKSKKSHKFNPTWGILTFAALGFFFGTNQCERYSQKVEKEKIESQVDSENKVEVQGLSNKEKAIIYITRSVQQGKIDREKADELIYSLTEENSFKVLGALEFVNVEKLTNIKKSQISELMSEKLRGGFHDPEPLKLECDGVSVFINTCNEYYAIAENCFPADNYMMKEFDYYEINCSILMAIKKGQKASLSYLDEKLLENLPQSIFSYADQYFEEERPFEDIFDSDDSKLKDLGLIAMGNEIKMESGGTIKSVRELLRLDINNDSIEDALLSVYYSGGGSMTISDVIAITSLRKGQYEIVKL